MDGVVVKQKRQQRGRTRAGCATCRLRRVKCDEAKPRCLRCIKAERNCDWEVVKGFKVVDPLAFKLPGTVQEQRGFDFFAKCTAPSLSGFFSNDFWQRVVLQGGIELPSLRHGVVALGAVHERFVSGSILEDSNYVFALRQYNKSIQELQKDMAGGKCTPEIALLCCALYISFDSLRGMTSSAIMHLHSGVKILQTLNDKQKVGTGVKGVASITDLRRLMSRLASQINSDMGDPSDPANDREDTIAILADSFGRLLEMHPLLSATNFESLEEARDHLYSFINGHLYHYYLRSLYLGSEAHSHLASAINGLTEPVLTSLHSWASAFQRFLSSNRATMTPSQTAGASLLQMHYQISQLLIIGQIVPDEHGQTALNTKDVFKPFSINFGEALMLIESLMQPTPMTAKEASTQHSSFYPDCGVVPMLFFIAMKCNDRRLRTKATDLLRLGHRREGTWDSETCLRIIEYTFAVEEANSPASDSRYHMNSPESVEGSDEARSDSIGSLDEYFSASLVIKDERAKRYIRAGQAEAERLSRSFGERGGVKHSLLYL